MTSFVAFVGVGKAGCKMANEFRKLGYAAYFVNSSAKDLATIDAPKNMKYQIPFAQGTNGNRVLAKTFCREYFDLIVTNIKSKLGNFTHIFFCFSAGGGTGSGITPLLIKNLAKGDEDTDYGVVCAVPSVNEHPQAKYNTYECFKEIDSIENLHNVYLVDNNFTMFKTKEVNLETVNELFAVRFNNTMLVVDTDDTGSVDETEMRGALSIRGCCTFADIMDGEAVNSATVTTDKIMLELGKGCGFTLYSLTNEQNFVQDAVESKFGKSPIFKAGKGVDDFVTVFGLPFPKQYINDMANAYTEDMDEIQNIEEDEVEVVKIKYIDPIAEKRKNTKIAKKAEQLLDEFEDF